MKVWKEKDFLAIESSNANTYIAVVLLENDVLLIVCNDGTAIGFDGKTYVNVSREIVVPTIPTERMFIDIRVPDDKIPPDVETDTELEFLGWTTDADRPVIL